MRGLAYWTVVVALLICGVETAAGVVITELHYHPPLGDELTEFVEVTNDSATPEDISAWSFIEGIAYTFPAGTVLGPYEALVVCADVDAVRTAYGIDNAVGNYSGRLDNGGERVTIANHAGVPVESVRYRDDGKWPVGPDGTGHTLALRDVHLDSGEPESWAQSAELGGTPGLQNFPSSGATVDEVEIIAVGSVWKFRRGSVPFSAVAGAWLAPEFDDTGWEEGPSGFGYGDGDDATTLGDMQNGYTAVACRRRFTLTAGDLSQAGDFFLAIDYDDGFCAFLNGQEFARSNCPSDIPVANATATGSREAGVADLFPIPRQRLVDGQNVIAIAGYNVSAGSSDFSLIPRVVLRRVSGGGPSVIEETLIESGDEWRIRRGTGPFSVPSSAWRESAFDDASWELAPSGFGYREVGDTFIAYRVPEGVVGNQAFGGALGMDFNVEQDVQVTRLGVFDSASDGLNRTITARLYNRDTRAELASLVFSPASPGELIDGSRFKDLASAVELSAGFRGTIVAEGYGAGEENGNQGTGPLFPALSTDGGGGAVSFVGGGRYSAAAGTFPDTADGGPADRYAAGTFEFQVAGAGEGAVVAPSGVATLLDDMPGAYTSLAARRRFVLTKKQVDAPGDLLLAVDYDDGFCAYLNGSEVVRVNCGAPGDEPAWDDVATNSRKSSGEQFFTLDPSLLLAGENVLAIVGLNAAADDGDFRLTARLTRRRVISVDPATVVRFNELFRGAVPGGGWVELYNAGSAPLDLSGLRITDDPARPDPFVFGEEEVLPGGFIVIDEAASGLTLSTGEVQLFLRDESGLVITSATFQRNAPPELELGTFAEARHPDGAAEDWITDTPTRGAPNSVPREERIVINEIFYNPPEGRNGEFVELLNLGDASIDVSGFSFDKGVQFTIPDGTEIAAGGYLVLSEAPDVLTDVYGVNSLGPYMGSLSNRGEALRLVDRFGNRVDEVRYFDGGDWSRWADGRGSSLELIDPYQDNSVAAAWEASDETDKAAWEELAFLVSNYVPGLESELKIHLVERGICLIDDVSVRRDGGSNLIPNGGFETSTSPWLIGGTHVHSGRVTDDSHSGGACLEVVSTGRGDTLVNRLEVETTSPMTSGAYDVALWARWQRGTSLLIVHGEYAPGPFRTTPCFTCGLSTNWSANSMSAALRMTVPLDLGTPGAENSARRRLRNDSGSDNLGPVLWDLRHDPPSPEPAASPTVLIRASDSDGIASVEVLYRLENPNGPFERAPLFDDGLHGDAAPGDGLFGGQLPAFGALARVVFYAEAMDTVGAVNRYPVGAPSQTHSFQVDGAVDERRDAYRVVLDAAATAELQGRPLHSNDLIAGTFVFNNKRAYQNIGVRYRGSPWGRPSRASLRLRFPRDDRFHHGRRDVNLSRSGAGVNEGAGLFLIRRNAIPGVPAPTPDYHWVRAWLNGAGLGNKADIEVIDGDFVDKWFGAESRGPLLKADGRFVFTDAGRLIGQNGWEGASLIHRGANKENYRGYYRHGMRQTDDDWDALIELTRALDPSLTPSASFLEAASRWIDLEVFFQVLGARLLQADCDAFGINNGHNGFIAFNSIVGKWTTVAFDVECNFRDANTNLFASADPGVSRLLSHPGTRRVYLRTLERYADGYLSSARAGPWLDALQAATGFSVGGIKSYIDASAANIRTALTSFQGANFRIVTNSGNDIQTDRTTVELDGEAPLSVAAISVSRNGGGFEILEPAWPTPIRWRSEIALSGARTEFEFLGFDTQGNIVGSTSIAVTSSAAPELEVSGWFPDTGPATGGTDVTYFGSGFGAGLQVFYGGAEATSVDIQSAEVVVVTTPPAPVPLPAGGLVDVRFVLGELELTLQDGFRYTVEGTTFERGDANADGNTDVSDALTILLFLFADASITMPCHSSADFDDSGNLNIADPIATLNFLFVSGREPAAPFPGCGVDPTPDELPCESFEPCEG